MKGELSVGQLIAFNMLSGRVTQPILRLSQLWQNFQQAKISIEKLSDILNNPAEDNQNVSKGSLPAIRGEVEFRDIVFRYLPNGPEILKKSILRPAPGKKSVLSAPADRENLRLPSLFNVSIFPKAARF